MIDGLSYKVAGQGSRTLLCLHGIGTDASSFHHQMSAFADTRVVAWNMPGYGASEVRQMPPDFAHLSQRLQALIDGLGGPVHLLGQSIGGMLALDHALRVPHQVASISLVATTPRFGGRDDSFKAAFLKARLDPLDQGQTMAQMAAETAPHLVGPDADPLEIKQIEAALARVPEATWRGILQCLVTFDRARDLGDLACPAMLVAGSVDRNAPVKTMEKMAARIPNAQVHVLDGAGHMLHQEQPQMFNALLSNFLNEMRPV
ncbi:MAG: alpha/beta fold hydrolase [Paracoccaceae bacterium]